MKVALGLGAPAVSAVDGLLTGRTVICSGVSDVSPVASDVDTVVAMVMLLCRDTGDVMAPLFVVSESDPVVGADGDDAVAGWPLGTEEAVVAESAGVVCVAENMEVSVEVSVVMKDGSPVMLTSLVGSVADDTPSLWV